MIENDGRYLLLTLHRKIGGNDEAFIDYRRISSVSPAPQGGSMVVTFESRSFYVKENPDDIVEKIGDLRSSYE